MRTGTMVVASLVLAACQKVETPEQTQARIQTESAAARAEIEAIAANYERWVAAGHMDSIATMVTDDHHSMPPNMPALAGKAAWVAWFTPLFAQGAWSEDIMTESVVANGPLAIERGRYTMNFVPGPGAPRGTKAVAETGKYVWRWQKVGGQWKLAEAIWNNDLPVKP